MKGQSAACLWLCSWLFRSIGHQRQAAKSPAAFHQGFTVCSTTDAVQCMHRTVLLIATVSMKGCSLSHGILLGGLLVLCRAQPAMSWNDAPSCLCWSPVRLSSAQAFASLHPVWGSCLAGHLEEAVQQLPRLWKLQRLLLVQQGTAYSRWPYQSSLLPVGCPGRELAGQSAGVQCLLVRR